MTEQPQPQQQTQSQNDKQVEELIRKRREELGTKSKEELIETVINMWHANAALNQTIINLSVVMGNLGHDLTKSGVNCSEIAKQIAPKTPEELKRLENTAQNQQNGFANRRERRNYEQQKADRLKQLQRG